MRCSVTTYLTRDSRRGTRDVQSVFVWRLLRKALNKCIYDQSIASGVVMNVSEDEEADVPAARLTPRAMVLHGKERRKKRNEALTLTLAPVAPYKYLLGIRRVVGDLCGPGANDDAYGDVSLFELLPQERHFRLLLGDTALSP